MNANSSVTKENAISAVLTFLLSVSARKKSDKLSVEARNLSVITFATNNWTVASTIARNYVMRVSVSHARRYLLE
jgi:hypothetical protein